MDSDRGPGQGSWVHKRDPRSKSVQIAEVSERSGTAAKGPD